MTVLIDPVLRCRVVFLFLFFLLAGSVSATTSLSTTTSVSRSHRKAERLGAELVTLDQLPLRTSGRYIVDQGGERVKWACINWYGHYSTTHVVGGLEKQNIQAIVDRIVDFGFNCIRLMYSLEGYYNDPVVSNATMAANPQLWGKRSMELFDLTVQLCTDAGLMVIVNNHVSKAGWCCHFSQDEGLWYTPEYNESMWLQSLVGMAERYRTNPLVVAIDLRNEVHDYEDVHLTWGDGVPHTDWAAAATKAGNAVLEVSPDVLIVVMGMCFGADLRPMRNKPIRLMYPHKVVYQTHNYLEYQFFEALTAMVTTWAELRNLILLAGGCLLLLLSFLHWSWGRLGKPWPTLPVFLMSLGFWVSFFALIAVVITWEMYVFGCRFCYSGAQTDILPWFIGACCIGGSAVLFGVIAAWWVIRSGRFKPRRSFEQLRRSVSQMSAATGSAPGPAGATAAVVPVETLAATVTTPNVAAASPGSKTAGDENCQNFEGVDSIIPSERAQSANLGDQDLMTTSEAAGGADGESAELMFGCCAPGCASVRWVRRRPGEPGRPKKVPWDCGLCCGLQCVISVTILFLVLTWFYIFAYILPTYWWMERHLDGLWGFALQEGHDYTAPVWMGEFGQQARGNYWLNFVRYLSQRDVDFAYWAINGLKWAEGDINAASGTFTKYPQPLWVNETFGLLEEDYYTVRHPWKLLDLQAISESPSHWVPNTLPCDYDFSRACGG